MSSEDKLVAIKLTTLPPGVEPTPKVPKKAETEPVAASEEASDA